LAISPTELIRELEKAQIASREVINPIQRELIEQRAINRKREDEADAQRKENVELRKEIAELRQELALVRQRQDDRQKQSEEWGRRGWGLFTVLLGAVMSLASGLIVTLARK
jgi:hypothetical protein